MEGYLATKWGTRASLSTGHPYKDTGIPYPFTVAPFITGYTGPSLTYTPNAWNFFGYTVCCSGGTQLVQNLTVNGTATSLTGGTYSALAVANTYVGYGITPYNNYFNGKIDDFRYYGRVLDRKSTRLNSSHCG